MSTQSVGMRYPRLVVRGAMLVNGRGTPAYGPVDIVVEDGRIADVVPVDPISVGRYQAGWRRPGGDHVIDAAGMYVLPGLVDMHTHVPLDEETAGPRGADYAYRLYLAHGVTTIRTCGFGTDERLVEHRGLSEQNGIVAPRLVVMGSWPPEAGSPEEAREAVRRLRGLGVDGIKIIPRPHVDRAIMEAMAGEVRAQGMGAGIAVHIPQNSELDALDVSEAGRGIVSIEHTYGIHRAALPGSQGFPPDYNFSDELDRFRWDGHVWREADGYPDRVREVLDTLIRNGTVWDPTMVVYEGHCDIERIQTRRWHARFTVPQLMEAWSPSPGRHATHFFDWKTSDEIAWREKFRIWMRYLRYFFDRGGTITVGSDTAFIYALYGFSTVRELELLQEAGIHPLDVVKIATTNAYRALGLKDLARGVVQGAPADLAVVDGNPLDNFKVMYGTGVMRYSADRGAFVPGGGVRWTIKGGVVFDARALLRDVEEYVREMRALRG